MQMFIINSKYATATSRSKLLLSVRLGRLLRPSGFYYLHRRRLGVSWCRQEFTAYAQKALDRLTRSIVQTSSAIQSSKWLAGAKVIYDAVRTRRAAQGLETKPFMEWAGLEHEVDRLVAGLCQLLLSGACSTILSIYLKITLRLS